MKKLCILILLVFICFGCGKKEEENVVQDVLPSLEVKKISIVDTDSNSRP